MSLKILCTFASCITKVNVRKLELSCDIIIEHNHFMVQETDALFQLLDPETDPLYHIIFHPNPYRSQYRGSLRSLGDSICFSWIFFLISRLFSSLLNISICCSKFPL